MNDISWNGYVLQGIQPNRAGIMLGAIQYRMSISYLGF